MTIQELVQQTRKLLQQREFHLSKASKYHALFSSYTGGTIELTADLLLRDSRGMRQRLTQYHMKRVFEIERELIELQERAESEWEGKEGGL